ncbi:MAG: hypothetical protein AAB660_01965 [Patescibacteria group bacterium]
MPKKIEDIVPSSKRSIRDIPLSVRKSEPIREVLQVESLASITSPPTSINSFTSGKTPDRKKRWIGALILIAIIALATVSLRGGAVFSYTQKEAELTFSKDVYVLQKTAKVGELAFSLIKLTGEKSTEVGATGEETVSTKAMGQVVIYNEQGVAQQLVKSTRLETPEKKIFRITENVTVPAKGSLEVTAVADEAGATHNIGLTDFTLPGLKGGPKFEAVFARSKTTMEGGFVGVRKKVSKEDLAKARTILESGIKSDLLSQAQTQAPADFVLFPDLIQINYELQPIASGSESTAKITLKGDLNAVIIKRADMALYLASQKLKSSDMGNQFDIPDLSNLKALFAEAGGNLVSMSAVKISLSGSAQLLAVTNELALSADLAGTNKSEINNVLNKYSSIKEASVVVRPFWKSSFPNDASKIKIEVR